MSPAGCFGASSRPSRSHGGYGSLSSPCCRGLRRSAVGQRRVLPTPRFGRAQSVACWAALSPGNDESAGKRKSGRTARGNFAVRCILRECANAARVTKSTVAAKYRSLMVRKTRKKAIIAFAHRKIRLIYLMLSRRQPHIDQGIDYAAMSAKKNAPRWIR
jgi:transposase